MNAPSERHTVGPRVVHCMDGASRAFGPTGNEAKAGETSDRHNLPGHISGQLRIAKDFGSPHPHGSVQQSCRRARR
jgi:hypothetical protein